MLYVYKKLVADGHDFAIMGRLELRRLSNDLWDQDGQGLFGMTFLGNT